MRNTTCTNTNELGEHCTRPRVIGSPVSLCQLHLLVAGEFAGTIEIPNRPILDARKPSGRNEEGHKPLFRDFEPSVVYYLRLGDKIKIGTSTNLLVRLKSLKHDVLLACEPGAISLERKRQRQFASSSVGHEWFEASPDLMTHIRRIREELGDPKIVWNRVVKETTHPVKT